jgi:Integral membrane protein DUF106.
MNSPTASFAIPHSQTSQNILLDSSIRDWVVLPLLIIMVFAGLIRHYLSLVLKSSKVNKIAKVEHRIKSTLSRSSRLRSGAAGYIAKHKWQGRIRYWTGEEETPDHQTKGGGGGKSNLSSSSSSATATTSGYLREEMQWIEEEEERRAEAKQNNNTNSGGGEGNNEEDDDMPDPMAMLGPMKGQAVFMAQNMILMQGIGYFFSGYILVKVPVPLTNGFKMMFQRGLDLSTLETSYVSSVSWYFLVMFGLRAFFKLVIDGDGSSQKDHMKAAMVQTELGHSMMGGPQKKFEAEKFLKGEIENLELFRYKSVLEDADRRLLGKRYVMAAGTVGMLSRTRQVVVVVVVVVAKGNLVLIYLVQVLQHRHLLVVE